MIYCNPIYKNYFLSKNRAAVKFHAIPTIMPNVLDRVNNPETLKTATATPVLAIRFTQFARM